eukprot:scaffold74653_cov56-Attheya_sp.AAC.2
MIATVSSGMICICVALLLATTSTTTHGFSSAPVMFGVLATGSGIRCSQLSAEKSGSPISKSTEPQIFQASLYDKPIVLIGSSSSGQGNELERLGASVVRHSRKGKLWPLSSPDQVSSLVGHLPALSSQDIVILDLDLLDKKNKQNDDHFDFASSVVKELYETHGLLSIYINVQHAVPTELEQRVVIPYTDFELCLKDEDSESDADWEHVEWELQRLLARAFLPPAIPGATEPSVNTASLLMGDHAFFLSLSFPHISHVEPYVKAMCGDTDAMEFRADLLEAREDRFEVLHQHQLLRKLCRPHAKRVPALPGYGGHVPVLDDVMPVVYTVRTAHQAGTWPDDSSEDIDRMMDTLELGLRSGVEVLDVESAWTEASKEKLLQQAHDRYATQILGSHHVVGKTITTVEAVALFAQCMLEGRAHGAKLVLSIDDQSLDSQAYEAAQISMQEHKIPHISLVLADIGKRSRILNIPFTPVTHESLPFAAAPGQMTARELMDARVDPSVDTSPAFASPLLCPKRYAILGHNIAYSVSPQMQGAAFEATGLPHVYGRADVEMVDEFINGELWNAPNFGGCSVTIPHKQAIMPHLDELTDAAQTIGSVNTVIAVVDDAKSGTRTLLGDNTDWKGIYYPLQRKLSSSSGGGGGGDGDGKKNGGCALILGGGGTARAAAYAATQLGLTPLYYNRTPKKVADLAATFGGIVLTHIAPDGQQDEPALNHDKDTIVLNREWCQTHSDTPIVAVLSTLPASVGFTLPQWLLQRGGSDDENDDTMCGGGVEVVLDVNYKPYHTALLTQATDAGIPVIRGSEMLWEQGVGQFELWTHRTAPYKVMKDVVLSNCLPPPTEDDNEESVSVVEQQVEAKELSTTSSIK